jgi:outer membrane biosynthesis protein TonB
MNTMTPNRYDQDHASQSRRQPQAHIFIYENLAYVRDRLFDKDRISIGRSPKADVVLDHQSIADFHALVHFEGEQAFLTNKFPNNGLRLNGRSVHLEALQHEDVIDIGPFSLKIKMNAADIVPISTVKASYSVRLVNRYDCPTALRLAAEQLAKMMRADVARVLPLIEKDYFVIKKNLDGLEATRWQNTLLKAGIICDVQIEESERPISAVRYEPEEDSANPPVHAETVDMIEAEPAGVDEPLPSIPAGALMEDEEDEEEEIWETPFSLHEKLAVSPQAQSSRKLAFQLQVVKTIGTSVIDVGLLAKGQKYHLDTSAGRICLADYRSRTGASVYITSQLSGYVENELGQVTADLDGYKTDNFLFRKGKQLYRIPLPEKGTVVVDDAKCQYRVSLAQSLPSPEVAVAPTPASFTWRHWAYSAGTHLLFLMCISVYLYFQAVTPKPIAPHFVKIDPSLLQRLEAARAPKPPKIEPPPPKPEPQKLAEKVEPPKKKPEKKRAEPILNASKTKPKTKKVAKAAPPSRHPNAGGGFGKGNIKNRNINQTGILSVLGTASLGGPSEAIAAVTNLDAVPVPGASEKNFTVGGLKGSLGNGKIAVASGEMVQTKGSHQVLRSAGARGKGEVAAMERGTTGQKQVQAMVSAKMSRTVKIEGGMSREMVKRVIDQHLEEITYCYETALMSNPSILGRIVFEWKILMDGRVGEIRIAASSVNSHEIHDCIKSAIKSWQFPKPVGAEVIVSYPFVFDLVAF